MFLSSVVYASSCKYYPSATATLERSRYNVPIFSTLRFPFFHSRKSLKAEVLLRRKMQYRRAATASSALIAINPEQQTYTLALQRRPRFPPLRQTPVLVRLPGMLMYLLSLLRRHNCRCCRHHHSCLNRRCRCWCNRWTGRSWRRWRCLWCSRWKKWLGRRLRLNRRCHHRKRRRSRRWNLKGGK